VIRLSLPEYQFKIERSADGKLYIFDVIRKKNILLTPEEWVRQNFIRFMNETHNIPYSRMVLEKDLLLNGQKKRIDVLVYNSAGKPVAIVECKASTVKIAQSTFDQAARYNMVFQVPYLIVTNGMEHFYSRIDHEEKSFSFLKSFPLLEK
jgi:type I site-specific restriction endonuclease